MIETSHEYTLTLARKRQVREYKRALKQLETDILSDQDLTLADKADLIPADQISNANHILECIEEELDDYQCHLEDNPARREWNNAKWVV